MAAPVPMNNSSINPYQNFLQKEFGQDNKKGSGNSVYVLCQQMLQSPETALQMIQEASKVDETIDTKMQNLSVDPSKLTKKDLTQKITKLQLTLLHVATMVGSLSIVKFLVGSVHLCPNQADIRGFTAGHHAALYPDNSILKFLMPLLKIDIKNISGGTCLNLRKLAYPAVKENPDSFEINWFDTETKQVKTMTSSDFQAKHQVLFSDETYFAATLQVEEWEKGPSQDNQDVSPYISNLIKAYAEFKKNPPKLALTSMPGNAGEGVKSLETIKSGSIVCDYVCERIKMGTGNPASLYRMREEHDAEKWRGYGSMIADGLPNLRPIPLPNTAGLETRFIFVAIETIKPGDTLCFDYQAHEVKWGYHTDIRPEAQQQFFQTFSMADMEKKMIMPVDFNTHPYLKEIVQFQYLLNSPKHLAYMVLKGHLSVAKLKMMIKGAINEELNFVQAGRVLIKAYEKIQLLDKAAADQFKSQLLADLQKIKIKDFYNVTLKNI